MTKRIAAVFLLLALLPALTIPVVASETQPQDPKPIHTVEELLAISEDPYGSYILMADLDLAGVEWKSMDFYGTFDGNGHAIVNLTVTAPGDEMPNSCDGNRKLYETAWFGMFGTLRDAQVQDLTLLNVRAVIDWDGPAFLGSIAGYAENAVISGCTVSGTLELRAHDRIFGVGGVVGYGGGKVLDCRVDVTLINTDTDPETKDEQFLGGIYATGFVDVERCELTLDGYVSDWGYVHCGGIVGMYMEYPMSTGQTGRIRENHVEGKITFFEKNADRRAYCKDIVGEMVAWNYNMGGNTANFLRDEKFTYDRELRPEMCDEPNYVQTITAPDCDSFGFTTFTCQGCGYAYTDCYTLFAHTVTDWMLTKAPTVKEEGLSVGTCACGQELTRTEPKLEPEPTTVPTTEAPAEPTAEAPTEPAQELVPVERDDLFYILMGAAIALAVLAVVLIICLFRSRKRR